MTTPITNPITTPTHRISYSPATYVLLQTVSLIAIALIIGGITAALVTGIATLWIIPSATALLYVVCAMIVRNFFCQKTTPTLTSSKDSLISSSQT